MVEFDQDFIGFLANSECLLGQSRLCCIFVQMWIWSIGDKSIGTISFQLWQPYFWQCYQMWKQPNYEIPRLKIQNISRPSFCAFSNSSRILNLVKPHVCSNVKFIQNATICLHIGHRHISARISNPPLHFCSNNSYLAH